MQSSTTRTAPVIPGFTVDRMLGCGGMAQVWLVTRELNDEVFAAKVIDDASMPAGHSTQYRPEGERAGELADILRRELQLLTRLHHEHLVRAHEVLVRDGQTVLLMDFAAGGSLAALVSTRGPLPVSEVVTIMTPIAGCVAYLHANSVMHGDLAPGNILFTEYGKPLLADLGLSRVAGESGTQRSGTAGFTDPYQHAGAESEGGHAQWNRNRADSPALCLLPDSDVYALGALTWYALTGRVPATTNQRPPLSMLVPDVPAELALLIEAALDADSSQRPTAAEFERTVFRSAAAVPVDLVEAVHESVLPQLLTRRDLREGRSGRQPLRRILAGSTRQLRSRRLVWPLVLALATVLLAAVAFSASNSLPPTAGGTPALQPQFTAEPVNPADPAVPAVPEALRQELASPEPAVATRALAQLRSYALNSGNLALLEEVNVVGSAAMSADQEVADRLRSDGQWLQGLQMSLDRAQVLPGQSAEAALVSITVATSAYQQRAADGSVVHSIGGTEQELIVSLQWEQGRWLIDRILAPAAGS